MNHQASNVHIQQNGCEGQRRFVARHAYLLLSGILLLALIVRVAALLDLRGTVYFQALLPDEALYHNWALKIAKGTYRSVSVYEFSPLPAYLFALLYRLFSPDPVVVRVLNVALGVASCLLIFCLGKRMGGATVGLLACLVASLYKPFILYSIVPLKTALEVFLFALCLYLLLVVLDKPTPLAMSLLGIGAGLTINVRPNFLIVLPLLLFAGLFTPHWSARSVARLGLLFLLGVSLAVAPFVVRNYRVARTLAVSPSQAGFNLYLGNNPGNPDPYYRPAPFASSAACSQGTQFTIEASRRAQRILSPQEASTYWGSEVIRMARADPTRFLAKLGRKTLALFNQFESADHYHVCFLSGFVKIFRLPFLSLWAILPLSMAGMAVTVRESKKLLAPSLAALFYGATLVAFLPNARYRLPLLAILIPFAALGLMRVCSTCPRSSRKSLVLYVATALLVLGVEFLPLPGVGDLTQYYNLHALLLDAKGHSDEAVQFWRRSSEMKGAFSSYADLSLAGKFLEGRDFEGAFACARRISDTSFAAPLKYELLGDTWAMEGNWAEAAKAYGRSLEINSGEITVRRKLIQVLKRIDPEAARHEAERLRTILAFYDPLCVGLEWRR
ncbi:MAG TPA: glycosyltransferase family 39 protein [Syntrophobacteria bacterium]|nr:glycosyltransferase family 39 protein [Syntrophobacteria bacterium]